jgi:hypothetical protein
MVSSGIKGALNMIPMMALVSKEVAEEAVSRFTEEEPAAVFLIQEVGHA